MPTHDQEILIGRCEQSAAGVHRLSVDDFEDPTEGEITSQEIHITAFSPGNPEPVAFCFRLSTVSARELINRLEAAIHRREG